MSGGVDLDARESYAHLDPAEMLAFAVDLPAQVEAAARIGGEFVLPGGLGSPGHIVLAGMGGSAVAGDFLAALIEQASGAPFTVCRSYQIPGFVGSETLFIASSHSGNTEETLAAASAALRRKAQVLCISTGGRLREFARRHAGPRVAMLEIPQTDPPMPPRAALGYSLIPLVCALETLGLYRGAGRQIREAIAALKALRDRVEPGIPTRLNRAKQLARSLHGKIPWVQGTVGLMSAAAYRWRCQFNENSKTLAYSSEYPELNHNEVVGWEGAERFEGMVEVVALRRPRDYWRNRARVDITTEKLVGPKARVHLIEPEGTSPLAQLLWTVYLGDFTSLYLAFLNGADPASIDSINTLKAELAELRRPGR